MTIYAIHDASLVMPDGRDRVVGYLFCFPAFKRYYIELDGDIDKWDAPALFSGQVKRKNHSIDHELSMKWIRQRIVPSERQNISSILRENKLKEYDEYRLLQLSCGRCAQDDCYITRAEEDELPDEIAKRLTHNVCDVMTLMPHKALVFFNDGSSRVADLGKIMGEDMIFGNVMADDDIYRRVKVSPGGFGIEWDDDRFIPARRLYASGTESVIRYDDVLGFARNRLADTSDVTARLGVSRQYVDQLAKQDRIHPVIAKQGIRFYSAAELEKGL